MMIRACSTCEFFLDTFKQCRYNPPTLVTISKFGNGSHNHSENGTAPQPGSSYNKNFNGTHSNSTTYTTDTRWPTVKEEDWCGKYEPNADLVHLIEVVQEEVNEQR